MATINSIGTATRDYSTLQAWQDAVPATPTGGYIGEAYNDSEFTAGVTIDGHTTSSTDFITLRCASGQGFKSNAGATTLPLLYDQTKGVGCAVSVDGPAIRVENQWITVDGLQFKKTGGPFSNGMVAIAGLSGTITNSIMQKCILQKSYTSTYLIPIGYFDGGIEVVNCIFSETSGATNEQGIKQMHAADLRNCTIVNTTGGAGTALIWSYLTTATLENCAVFGWPTISSGTQPGGDYNATDGASGLPGANSIFNLTASNELVNPASDFRPKSGNHLVGTRDQTHTSDLDIIDVARSTTSPTIGAREFVAVGGAAYARGPFTFHPGRSPGKSPVSGRFYRNRPAGPPSSTVATVIQQMLQLLGVGS